MRAIASRQHDLVKRFRAITRGSRTHLLLDGWHLLSEAVRARIVIDTIALVDDPLDRHAHVLDTARARGADVVAVSNAVIDAMSPVRTSSGVVAIAERPDSAAVSLLEPAPALALAIIGVQDPGNVGSAIRSAAGGGATGVACDTTSADPWSWKALRASMGSAFQLPVARVDDMPALVDSWRAAGVSVLATVPRGGRSPYDLDLRRPTAILMGGEGSGLPSPVLAVADTRVSIPMREGIDSLNVAVAAALLVFEARRQR
jgi:RNA methyltransferase, TrmH family